ncbi:PP2C family protein-serine/threonine phosphatase [Nocardioides pacificus]
MPAPVRERHARLLAHSRASEPRARLAQASSRAEFLLRLSRTVSAVQHPGRASEAMVSLLVEEMVDFAQVTLWSGTRQITSAAVQGSPIRSTQDYRADHATPALDETARQGITEQVMLSTRQPARRAVIDSVVADASVADDLDRIGTEILVLLPLTSRGRTFGVLSLGRAPGFAFDEGSLGFLDDLAQRISVVLDATLVVAESRHVASVLRESLTPPRIPEIADLDIATFYRVAHEHEAVGGDFFDVHGPVGDQTVLLGDVAGKGVEAAVAAKRIRNAVRTAAHVNRSPGWILGLVNRVLVSEATEYSETLATAVCARLRPSPSDGPAGSERLTVDLAGAGHPAALVLRADGTLEQVASRGPALGLDEAMVFEETTIELAPHDTLVLHTDGITEARGSMDMYGEQRLHDLLRQLAGGSSSALVEGVAMAVSTHIRDHEHDDIALIALQFRPGCQ